MRTSGSARRYLLGFSIAGTVVLVAALAVTVASRSVWAASGPPVSYWHIGYYTPSVVGAVSNAEASSAPNGVASLHFTNLANTARLVTDNKAKFPSLLGDLTNRQVSTDISVSGLTPGAQFIFYGEPYCGTTSFVRFYFQTGNVGGFDETHYWWSNPMEWDLTSNGATTLSTSFDGANWSDYYGHFGTGTYASGFNDAVSHVTQIGLSFGGGCFFENGVGTTDGSGTFTIASFVVS